MASFKKSVIKKQLEVEDDEPRELIDVRLQIELDPHDKYEDVRALLIKRLDRRFTELFAAELGVMPERMAEGKRWRQQRLFDDPVTSAVNFLRDNGATLSRPGDEDEGE